MRLFQNLAEAESEIRRDLAKGAPVTSTRVQQRTGLTLNGRERLGYEYGISHMEDLTVRELIAFGKDRGFPLYQSDADRFAEWMSEEINSRLFPEDYLEFKSQDNELLHPALKTTIEGNHPSYTYPERMGGMVKYLVNDLRRNRDSRRAFWPIFQPQDAVRAAESTRVPCSLGYQPLIRRVGNHEELIFFYLERSCDFDNFWLTDVWFAREIQKNLADRLGITPGLFHHFIISFHSFQVDDQEIY